MPARDAPAEFAAKSAEREKRKEEELAAHIGRAPARKTRMAPLADAEIPAVRAFVAEPVVSRTAG